MNTTRLICMCFAVVMAAPAYAERLESCAKVDYAEAKDWTVDELERNYCHDLAAWNRGQKLALEYVTKSPTLYKFVTERTAGCDVQAALYERVLKNVHKRQLPSCS